MEKEILVGEVTHYFTAIGVGIIKVKKSFKKGNRLHFKGSTTNFYQNAYSMQLNHKDIATAPKGEQIGLKVDQRVREGDKVYLVEKIKEKKSKKTTKTLKRKRKTGKKAKKGSKKTKKKPKKGKGPKKASKKKKKKKKK